MITLPSSRHDLNNVERDLKHQNIVITSDVDETINELGEDIQDDGEMDLDTKDTDYKAPIDDKIEFDEDELVGKTGDDDPLNVGIDKQTKMEVLQDIKMEGNAEKGGDLGPVEVGKGTGWSW